MPAMKVLIRVQEYILLYRRVIDNPLYIDTRYNDKIRYNDNLTVTKPSLKR